MAQYLISFPDGAMDFPEKDLPDVEKASLAVVEEARKAGVWVFGAGVLGHDVSLVGTDGSVSAATYPGTERHLGGFSIIDVATREEALDWAARIAASCRCAQEVRELMPDPEM